MTHRLHKITTRTQAKKAFAYNAIPVSDCIFRARLGQLTHSADKRRHMMTPRLTALLVAFGLLLNISACCVTVQRQAEYTVRYEVTGGHGNASLITMINERGGQSEYPHRELPWLYSFQARGDTWVFCSASDDHAPYPLVVTIYVNDELFQQASGEGYSITVTASGTVEGDLYMEEVEDCPF
ncbi:MAG: hypothetical protein JSW54_02575 [Fidelibacterota bacterium]|nr:MAG: hypothetical protein JSW54_02575 [Candidatus Neomarinimicrobiota bacterium]